MARRRKRTYESPLRAEQMDRTREKLIEAATDLVAEAGGEELSIRAVAARAGVSVPTAYRYFADRGALLEALAAWIDARIGGPKVPTTAQELSAWARQIYVGFDENDRLMRAQLHTPVGRAVRARNRASRRTMLLELAERSFPSAPPRARRRAIALLQMLVNVPAWTALHDEWGMSGAEAGELSGWAVEVIFEALRRDPEALDFDVPGAPRAEAPPEPRARRRPAKRRAPT